ncbi:response regulator [Hymenobacter cellulosivorans]|uniref:Response regulator transcription factor n=1 Tax=Hymenobacter cellulosivorans TaxID=2932249 RepID=A0ABY4FBF0_9BACT|nr:response regulator transcription factor [Hymenobacter cellulosivorans]UOQ53264.1 response regulator transcription factor [Hymenobacter cellulosivorans]
MHSRPCRLLIVDDHLMLTQSLALLLTGQPDMQVVGQLASGTALLEWLAQIPAATPPADVVLLDLHLPGPDGLTLLPTLQQYPQLRVLVFSTAASPELIERVAAAGAQGFVAKSADAEHLLEAIRSVHAGQKVFPPGSRRAAPASGEATEPLLRLHRLSSREREIVGLIRTGLTTRDIADRLSLSEFTVGTHRRNIMHKLELPNMAALLQFAFDHGL